MSWVSLDRSFSNITVAEALIRAERNSAELKQSVAMKAFEEMVSLGIRGCKFARVETSKSYVYMDGEYMPMGWIGYGDYSSSQTANRSGRAKYGVHAIDIQNRKYRDYSYQRYMRMSKDISIATRYALGSLRNYRTTEIAGHCSWDVSFAIRQRNSSVEDSVSKALYELGVNGPSQHFNMLEQELKTLLASGHEFTNAQMPERLNNYFALKKEQSRVSGDVSLDFVYSFRRFDREYVSVMRMDRVNRGNGDSNMHGDDVNTYILEEAPKHIQDKVATLSMFENKYYVDNVGFKYDSRAYFLFPEEVTT